MLDLNPRYVAMLHDLMARYPPDLHARPAGVISRFREALTESNLPIFVDVHGWALLPASFHPRILSRYEALCPGAALAVAA